MTPVSANEKTLLDVSRVLARHWRLSLACLALSLVASILALWFLPRSYHSQSQLYVRLGRDSTSLDPTAMIGRTSLASTLPSTRENEINTVTEILSSRSLAERVVDALGPPAILLDQDSPRTSPSQTLPQPPIATDSAGLITLASAQMVSLALPLETPTSSSERERAITKLQRMVQVQAVKKSDVVNIDCESRSPRLAQSIVASLTEFYLAQHLRLNQTAGAHEFLAQQATQMHAALTRTAEDLRKLKDQTGLASPEIQRDLLVTRAARLEDELLATATSLASTEAETKILREKIGTLPATSITADTVGIESHGLELMRNELYRLRMVEQDMASRYTDENVLLRQARVRSAAAKKALDAEAGSHEQVTSGPNIVYEQSQLALVKLEPLLNSLQAKAEKLQAQLANAREQIKSFNASELQIAELTRDLKRQETDYQAYAEHLEQTRIDQALESERISNISIIQPATFEPTPTKPKSLLIVGLGLLIGLSSAIGLPLLVDAHTRTANEAQLVGTPTKVAAVPPIPRRMSGQLSGNA